MLEMSAVGNDLWLVLPDLSGDGLVSIPLLAWAENTAGQVFEAP